MSLTIIKKSSDYLDYILDGLTGDYRIIEIESRENSFWRLMHLLFNGRTESPTRFLSSYFSNKTLQGLKSVISDKVLILGAVDARMCNIISKVLPSCVEKNIWIWNELGPMEDGQNSSNGSEIKTYVFSHKDSEIYGYPYKHQVYRKQQPLHSYTKSDFYWIGKPKNRRNLILSLKKEFEGLGYNCDFHFIENPEDYVSYKQNLEFLKTSRCLVDIVKPSYEGLSLRVMEALFFNKKLVTNNKFVRTCDFYNPSNIFVLGVDNDIKSFMSNEYIPVSEDIKSRYDINNWIKEFE